MTEEQHMNSSDSSWRKIAFFGRIMANVSHEFNNIITVISELAGLLKDLTLMSQKGREIPPEKLASISENISRQVARGKNLITHMNRFSHSSDEPVTRVDAGQIVENMQVLTDRLFKNRQTVFSYTPSKEECTLTTDPFELRHIIFSCMDYFLEASSREVSMSVHRREDKGELEWILSGKIEPAISNNIESRIAELQKQAVEINGQLDYSIHETGVQIRLILPEEKARKNP